MKKIALTHFIILCTSFFLILQGQVKYGKLSKEEIAVETTSDDAEFGAVILNDYGEIEISNGILTCLLYTSPSPRDQRGSRMPSSA